MKKLFILLSLAATLAASAVDFSTVQASMTWTPIHSITNQVGDVRQARTAPASPEFWAAWRTNKPAMKSAGFSARPTSNGWQAIQYVKGGNQ
ncbi:MAG: hypothetical protein WCH99_19950 [Verrucomicrobiota bacterium]